MKNIILFSASALLLWTSCQSTTKNDNTQVQEISKEAIIIHDEIMPQIAHFDRTTIKIDSLLATDLDESAKNDLMQLKVNLEDATDNMMTWMRDYSLDSTDINYQEAELVKIKDMKKQFENVSLESNTKLAAFK